jgi:Putative Ig domain
MMKSWHGFGRLKFQALAVMACLTVAACDGGSGTPASTGTVSGQVTSVVDGAPVAGATVRTAAGSATSAADGSFTVSAVAGTRTILQVEADGFAETFPVGRVAAGVTTALKALLQPTGYRVPVTVAAGDTVSMPQSTAQVTIPPNGLVPKAGGSPADTVTVSITPINPAINPNVMPGGFLGVAAGGGPPAPMESFGAMLIDIRDNTGARYTLAPGKTSTIRIPVGTRSTAPPATSPLFFFDESTGLWNEEGTATLQGVAPNQYYEGIVTHFSYWNADALYDVVYVSGCLRDSNNQPVAGALVETNGLDYSGEGAAFSAADGTFRVGLRTNSVATLSAVDFPLLSLAQPALSNVVTVGPAAVDFTLPTCLVLGANPLRITTTSLSEGSIGVAYNQPLIADGGAPGYTWSLNPGSNPLPAGLTLTPWGVITGTPTTTVTRTITVKVVDTSGAVMTKSLSLRIKSGSSVGGGGTLTITGAPASVGGTFVADIVSFRRDMQLGLGIITAGEPHPTRAEGLILGFEYDTGVLAGHGVTFFTSEGTSWACTGTYIGPGMYLPSGTCAGVTVDRVAGTVSFVDAVLTNLVGSRPPITLNGTLNFTPLTSISITSASPLAAGIVNQAYSVTLTTLGGTQPFTWSLLSGALPTGLTLNAATGQITGTPTSQGTFTFTIKVQDSAVPQQSNQKQFSVTVIPSSSGGGFGIVTITGGPTSLEGLLVPTEAIVGSVPLIFREMSGQSIDEVLEIFFDETGVFSLNLYDWSSIKIWGCDACNGATLDRTAGTITFENVTLPSANTGGVPITLNGTLTFEPF